MLALGLFRLGLAETANHVADLLGLELEEAEALLDDLLSEGMMRLCGRLDA